jgi:hypothetical protein
MKCLAFGQLVLFQVHRISCDIFACNNTSRLYSERKITASLGNVTVTGEKYGKGKGEARRPRVRLSMYSVTENIYYSQLSSVAILLQLEPNCFTSYNTRKWLRSLSLCAIVLRSSPPSHVSTCNGQRSSQLFYVHYMFDETTKCYVFLIEGLSSFLRRSWVQTFSWQYSY